MRRLGIVIIAMIAVLSSCGREQVCGVRDKGVVKVSAEEVSTNAGDPGNDTKEIPMTIYNIGGQLLQIAYDDYRAKGLGEKDISRLPEGRFRDNLSKLYRDLKSATE